MLNAKIALTGNEWEGRISLEIQNDRQVVYLFMAAFPFEQDGLSLNSILSQGFLRQNQTVKDECLLNLQKALGSQDVINRSDR